MEKIKLVLISILISILVIVGFYWMVQSQLKCDEHVILTDGTEMDCREIQSYTNGMSVIILCDGKKLIIPNYRIKEVKTIK